VIAVYLGSVFMGRYIFIPRYFVFLNPILLWNVAAGCEVLWRQQRVVRVMTGVGVAVFALFSFHAYDYDKQNWRGLARIAVEQKASLVLTTQVRGISIPYYSQAGIPVVQFAYGQDVVDFLRERLKTSRVIWIADEKWAAARYEIDLVSALNKAKITHRVFRLVNGAGDSVFGIAIYASD
jgi:hypothetical protein